MHVNQPQVAKLATAAFCPMTVFFLDPKVAIDHIISLPSYDYAITALNNIV